MEVAVFTLLGTVIAAIAGILSAVIKSNSDKNAKHIERMGPDWQGFYEMSRQDWEDRFSELTQKMEALEDRLQSIEQQRSIAFAHIRALRRTHHDPPPVPEELEGHIW